MILAILTLTGGCATWTAVKERKYATLSADLSRDPEAAAQNHTQALELIEGGELEQAEALLREALVADVSFGPAHNSLGVIYYMTGRMYLAAWEFEMAARTMPTLGEPHNNLGLVYEHVRRFDDAVKAYGMAATLDPQNPEYVGNLARARLRRGDSPQDVQQLLSKVASFDPRPQWSEWAQRRLALSGQRVLATARQAPWDHDHYEELRTPETAPEEEAPPDRQPLELPMPRFDIPSRPEDVSSFAPPLRTRGAPVIGRSPEAAW